MIVLDAGAFMALCKREQGAFELRRLLDAHRKQTFVHAVNSLEIFYGIEREFGQPHAERVWKIMDKCNIATRSDFDRDFLRHELDAVNAAGVCNVLFIR